MTLRQPYHVGFIQDLPHDLVEAFYATLQETSEADLLLHVVDASSEQRNEQIDHVNDVLKRIGANNCEQLMVYNKIDQTHQMPHIDMGKDNNIKRVWISALEDQGIHLLHSALQQHFELQRIRMTLRLPLSETELRGELYDQDAVLKETFDPVGVWEIEVLLKTETHERFLSYQSSPPEVDEVQHKADFFVQSE